MGVCCLFVGILVCFTLLYIFDERGAFSQAGVCKKTACVPFWSWYHGANRSLTNLTSQRYVNSNPDVVGDSIDLAACEDIPESYSCYAKDYYPERSVFKAWILSRTPIYDGGAVSFVGFMFIIIGSVGTFLSFGWVTLMCCDYRDVKKKQAKKEGRRFSGCFSWWWGTLRGQLLFWGLVLVVVFVPLMTLGLLGTWDRVDSTCQLNCTVVTVPTLNGLHTRQRREIMDTVVNKDLPNKLVPLTLHWFVDEERECPLVVPCSRIGTTLYRTRLLVHVYWSMLVPIVVGLGLITGSYLVTACRKDDMLWWVRAPAGMVKHMMALARQDEKEAELATTAV